MESKEISVKRGSCEVSEQKSKFSYRHAELRAVKVKKTNEGCSGLLTVLFKFFVLRKGKQENSFLFFPFHCNRGTGSIPDGKLRSHMLH